MALQPNCKTTIHSLTFFHPPYYSKDRRFAMKEIVGYSQFGYPSVITTSSSHIIPTFGSVDVFYVHNRSKLP